MKKFLILSAAFLLCASSVWAEIGIEATISPSRVVIGEPLTLTVTVNGATSGVKPPKLPALANFHSYSQGHSQEISFINGKMSSRNVFSFVLLPSVAGKHVIGQLEIEIDGKIFKTGVLEVEVVDSNSSSGPSAPIANLGSPRSKTPVTAPSPRSLPPEYMAGRDVFVRAWVDKEEVYVNEPIYLTYTIYTRVSATFKGFEEEAETTGFWVEEFPPQSAMNRTEKELAGQRYVVADVRMIALFPTDTGKFTVKPGILKIDAELVQRNGFDTFQSNDIFGWRTYRRPQQVVTQIIPKLLATDPIPVTVRPLPEAGRPAGFNGAVGNYRLTGTVDRAKIEEGEPVTYTLKLTGEGNLNTVVLPKLPAIDHFKSYDSSSSTKTSKERLIVEGTKTLETVLIPKKPGRFTIPSVSFAYFNPDTNRYEVQKTDPISIEVTAAEGGPVDAPIATGPAAASATPRSLSGDEIRYIKTSPGVLRASSEPLYRTASYWWIVLGLLITSVVVFIARIIFEKAGQNVVGARFRRSHRVARERLKSARANMKNGSEKEFYESLSLALYGYFSDKFNLGPGEFSIELVDTRLRGRVSEEDAQRLKDIITQIHFGRFGRAESGETEMKSLYKQSDQIITAFEVGRARRANRAAAAAAIAIVFALGGAMQAHAAEPAFDKSVAAYQKGDYKSAAVALEELVDSGKESAAVYYNLGNAYFKSNRKARAAWAYERALRLDPRDEDIRVNLAALRKQLQDKYEEPFEPGFVGWVAARIAPVRSDELAIAFAALVGFFSILILAGAFVRGLRKTLLRIAPIAFFVAFLLAAALYVRATAEKDESAVIAEREIYIRYGPTQDSTKAFLLHEGAKVHILKESGDWRWIRYGQSQKGWISKESLLVI